MTNTGVRSHKRTIAGRHKDASDKIESSLNSNLLCNKVAAPKFSSNLGGKSIPHNSSSLTLQQLAVQPDDPPYLKNRLDASGSYGSQQLDNHLISQGSFNSPFFGVRNCSASGEFRESFEFRRDHRLLGRCSSMPRNTSNLSTNSTYNTSAGGSTIHGDQLHKDLHHLHRASRALSKVLRHTFHAEGLKPLPGCFFEIAKVLNCKSMKQYSLTLNDLIRIVNQDGKSRFALAFNNTGQVCPEDVHVYIDTSTSPNLNETGYVRANQGHSKSYLSEDIFMQSYNLILKTPEDCNKNLHIDRYAFHGTSWLALHQILSKGYLRPMNRYHVHFSKTIHSEIVDGWTTTNSLFEAGAVLQHAGSRTSGIRRSADVAIVIDVREYLEKFGNAQVSPSSVILGGQEELGHDAFMLNRYRDGAYISNEVEEKCDYGSDVRGINTIGEVLSIVDEDSTPVVFTINEMLSKRLKGEAPEVAEDRNSPDLSTWDPSQTQQFFDRGLDESTGGRLCWEISKNSVILCSGWHDGEATRTRSDYPMGFDREDTPPVGGISPSSPVKLGKRKPRNKSLANLVKEEFVEEFDLTKTPVSDLMTTTTTEYNQHSDILEDNHLSIHSNSSTSYSTADESEEDSFNEMLATKEGVPTFLFKGIIDLLTGEWLSIEEATKECKSKQQQQQQQISQSIKR